MPSALSLSSARLPDFVRPEFRKFRMTARGAVGKFYFDGQNEVVLPILHLFLRTSGHPELVSGSLKNVGCNRF